MDIKYWLVRHCKTMIVFREGEKMSWRGAVMVFHDGAAFIFLSRAPVKTGKGGSGGG